MGTYRKRPVEIQAHRWFANGDHPDDYSRDHASPDGTVWTAQQRYDQGAEGDVVRYYRHPPVDPNTGEISASDNAITLGQLRHCDTPTRFRRVDCEHLMHDHGWIDTLEGGHTVCPGDWIITGVQGEHYPCKDHIFTETYEPAGSAALNQGRTITEPAYSALTDACRDYVDAYMSDGDDAELPEAADKVRRALHGDDPYDPDNPVWRDLLAGENRVLDEAKLLVGDAPHWQSWEHAHARVGLLRMAVNDLKAVETRLGLDDEEDS